MKKTYWISDLHDLLSIEEALDTIIQEKDLSNSKTTLEIKETDDEIEVSDEDNKVDRKWLFMYSALNFANKCFWIIQIVRSSKISIIQVTELLNVILHFELR